MSIPAGPESVAAVGSDYATLAELKTQLTITDAADDASLTAALTESSRAIDEHCGRHFDVPSAVSVRVFEPNDDTSLEVDDIATTTGLVVRTDDNDDGAFETTWAISTDFIVAPHNAITDGLPVTRLTGVGSRGFPIGTMRPTVQVTAQFGWVAVPAQVKRATLIMAARLFRRRNTPEGVAGGSDFGVVRISRWEDPDVVRLLAPFVRPGRATGWGIG